MVDRPDGFIIGQRVIAGVVTEVDTPANSGFLPKFLPNLGENVIIDLTVVQQKAAAIVQNLQGLPDFVRTLIPDVLIFEGYGFCGGRQGLTKQGKTIEIGRASCRERVWQLV